MKINFSWLRKYISLNSTIEEVVKILPLIGHEVGSVEYVGVPLLENVYVGEVLRKEKHPNADKLNVCMVQVKEGEEPYEIVCGAQNYSVGDRVPVALAGAELPNGIKIKQSEIRGVISNGMMCSPGELGLKDTTRGLMILDDKADIGVPINDILGEGDFIIDLEITANRGDCLSHLGVARELGAYFDLPILMPNIKQDIILSNASNTRSCLKEIHLETERCVYYTAWSIKDVKVGPSPQWLVQVLESVGQQSVNNIVDITNYVMLEMGQPLHAFDKTKIANQTLYIRNGKTGEKFTGLDNKVYELSEEDIVIADCDKILAAGGIIGSKESGVGFSTQEIVIESAYFHPGTIRRTARKLGVSTGSSYRFERDVDPDSIVLAARRAIDLILEIAGGSVCGVSIEKGTRPVGNKTISIDAEYVNSICGFRIEAEDIKKTFQRLGFLVSQNNELQHDNGHSWKVIVPGNRRDVDRPIDLVEEFIRIYGTHHIPKSAVKTLSIHQPDDLPTILNQRIASLMVGQGFQECLNYSMRSGEETQKYFGESAFERLALLNPLASDQSHMRTSLLPGLLDNLKHNLSHHNSVGKLFELGQVFIPNNTHFVEAMSVGFLIMRQPNYTSWQTLPNETFFSAKQILEYISELARLPAKVMKLKPIKGHSFWQEHQSGTFGDIFREGYTLNCGLIHPNALKSWDISELVYGGELIIQTRSLKDITKSALFQNFTTFPSIRKDFSLVMDANLFASDVVTEIEKLIQKISMPDFGVHSLKVFDIYEGAELGSNKKSLAFRLEFKSEHKTLTDEAVNVVFNQLLKSISSSEKFIVRN